MKNIGNLFVRLFAVSLLAFRYFSTIVALFGAGVAPFFTAPAPAPNKPFQRLRLRLRLRTKCVGSGGSGSGSASLELSIRRENAAEYFIINDYAYYWHMWTVVRATAPNKFTRASTGWLSQ